MPPRRTGSKPGARRTPPTSRHRPIARSTRRQALGRPPASPRYCAARMHGSPAISGITHQGRRTDPGPLAPALDSCIQISDESARVVQLTDHRDTVAARTRLGWGGGLLTRSDESRLQSADQEAVIRVSGRKRRLRPRGTASGSWYWAMEAVGQGHLNCVLAHAPTCSAMAEAGQDVHDRT
jgi:hypothetical protein